MLFRWPLKTALQSFRQQKNVKEQKQRSDIWRKWPLLDFEVAASGFSEKKKWLSEAMDDFIEFNLLLLEGDLQRK
jgi:hypothetical protein